MLLATLALCTIFLPSGSGTDIGVQGQCKMEVTETIEQEVEMAYTQVTAPNTTVQDGIGWCLRHTQSVFASPVAYPSARKAWDGQKGRHTGIPPLGISVPIWFDHYGTYGSPAYWDNWGHVATRLPDGRVLTSPFKSSYGSEIYPDIQSTMDALGGNAKYLGWSEYMNGKQVVKYEATKPNPQPATPAEEEDEDVKAIYYMNGKNYVVGIFDSRSGFFTEYTTHDSRYNNRITGLGTGSFVSVTKSHYNAIKASCAVTRQGK